MPVSLTTDDGSPRIVLEGNVVPEEVDDLFALIHEHPDVPLNLSGCTHLHTTALQLLLISGRTIAEPMESDFWKQLFTTKGAITDENNTAG